MLFTAFKMVTLTSLKICPPLLHAFMSIWSKGFEGCNEVKSLWNASFTKNIFQFEGK
jgi:hypothetical protein